MSITEDGKGKNGGFFILCCEDYGDGIELRHSNYTMDLKIAIKVEPDSLKVFDMQMKYSKDENHKVTESISFIGQDDSAFVM